MLSRANGSGSSQPSTSKYPSLLLQKHGAPAVGDGLSTRDDHGCDRLQVRADVDPESGRADVVGLVEPVCDGVETCANLGLPFNRHVAVEGDRRPLLR